MFEVMGVESIASVLQPKILMLTSNKYNLHLNLGG